MRKVFISAMIIAAITVTAGLQTVFAANNSEVKEAIKEYKDGNYLGCISDLKLYTAEDDSNAVAWYYLGSSYMKIAMKSDAHDAFDKVIELNTVPKLTSYSIQAKMCMENPQKCNYQKFTNDEIKELKANPATFMEQYFANIRKSSMKSSDTLEIEKLIGGRYGNNIHPDAQNFIMQQKTRTKQSEINKRS